MRLVDFSTILLDAVNLCGFDSSNVSDQNFRTIRQFANQRLRLAWESYPWFSLTKYASASVTNDTVTNVKTVQIPTDCGEVVGVYTNNPLATTQAVYVSYVLTDFNGTETIVVNTNLETVYIEYRIKRPEITGNLYKSIAYAKDSVVYFDTGSNQASYIPVDGFPHTGNFFKASASCTTAETPTNSNKWVKVEIPYIFASYISRGIFSDFLRSEQQYEDAGKAETDATGILDQEYDKELRQTGQIRRINFIDTY